MARYHGWCISFGAKCFAWYMTFALVGTGALLFAWGNELCGQSAEERAILLGWLNTMGYVFNAWVPLYAYPAEQAPYYKYGYKVNAALWGIYLIGIPAIVWLSIKFPTKKAPEEDGDQGVEYIKQKQNKGESTDF